MDDAGSFFQGPPRLGNTWTGDPMLRSVLTRVLPAEVLAAVTPHLHHLGQRAASDRHTIDRYKLSATSYGLLPRAVVPLAGNRIVAVGAGTPGGDVHDYRWLQRRQQGKRWVTQSYQVAAGRHSEGHDAVAGGAGVAAVGIGQTAAGNRLEVRESGDGGRTWQTAVELAGVDRSTARLAARGAALLVTAMIEGAAVVIGCDR